MAFTTEIFVFVFFPINFIIYYLITLMQQKSILCKFLNKYRASDLVLIGISSLFYTWACFDDIFKFFIYILIVYLFGVLIQSARQSSFCIVLVQKKDVENKKFISLAVLPLIAAIILFILILAHFKYTELLARIWNFLLRGSIIKESPLAPLGISFITFSAVSYLADVYLDKADSGNLIDCSLYLTFFPKVVSGPIVLWRDFRGHFKDRKITASLISEGIDRIMIGFAKKLILADTFGACIASASGAIDTPTAFGVTLLYMLQIYYDFSGYSDIAIGLSNMLGFSLKENFNFPYLSCSITEFWRRWHISLGTWFREYIYFPLGGNRISKKRTMINIGIVFLLTGLWHGAGWTYMTWGMVNGICNITEKLLSDNKLYQRIPKIIKWFLTMAVTYFCWVLFRFNSFSSCKEWIMLIFGIKKYDNIPYTWQYYFDTRMITLVVIGVFGATILGLPKIQGIYQKFIQTKCGYLILQIVLVTLFIFSIMFMVNSNYSPFIYFQY